MRAWGDNVSLKQLRSHAMDRHQVHMNGLLPKIFRHSREGFVPGDSCIVNQDVQCSTHRLVNGRCSGFRRNIEGKGDPETSSANDSSASA